MALSRDLWQGRGRLRMCVCLIPACMSYKRYLYKWINKTYSDWYNKLNILQICAPQSFPANSWKRLWLLLKIPCSETPVSRWSVMVDGWWMLSPCGVPAGTEGRREGKRARIISAELRKCKTAETKCQSWELWTDGGVLTLVVCVLCTSVAGVNVRGEKRSFPHATDKSHLSGRLSYKTWGTMEKHHTSAVASVR